MSSMRFDLQEYDIHVETIIRGAPPSRPCERGLRNESSTAVASSGALIAMSGELTGRPRSFAKHEDSASETIRNAGPGI